MTLEGIFVCPKFFSTTEEGFLCLRCKSNPMQKIQLSVYTLLFLVLSIGILFIAREFLIPLALSAILAMLFIPICRWLELRGMHRALAAIVSVLVLVGAVGLIVFLLSWQLSGFTENMDKMKEQGLALFQQLKDWIDSRLGISPKQQEKIIEEQGNGGGGESRSEEHTSELQSRPHLVCRLLLEKK